MTRAEPIAVGLLDRVYAAVRAADYGALAGLEQLLTAEIARPSTLLTHADLRLIRRRAERNAGCLLAAGRGIRAARRRLAEIKEVSASLVTYDCAGKRAEVSESRRLAQRF